MTHIIDFQCNGLCCKDCETCKYDEDLFIPKGESKRNSKSNMEHICNYCGYLTKNYDGEERRFFNACCSKMMVDCGAYKRPMVIDHHTYEMADIKRPSWCPNMNQNDSKPLSLPSKIEDVTIKLDKDRKFSSLTYSEKKDFVKTLKPILKWEDIKEDHYYVIPKVSPLQKKIIRVESKSDTCIRCHEISEYTGSEFSTITTIYPNDVDVHVIVELRNF